jgi:hypothetical protein
MAQAWAMRHWVYVAKGTPKEEVDALNAALRKALSDPAMLAKLKDLGTVPFPNAEKSRGEAGRFVARMERSEMRDRPGQPGESPGLRCAPSGLRATRPL